MNRLLDEINQMYLPIQQYIVPVPEDLVDLQNLDPAIGLRMAEEASSTYQLGLEKFRGVAPTLTSEEMIEGYLDGCRLLQCHLCGQMSAQFDAIFVPLMIREIRAAHPYTAPVFLQVLGDQLGKDAASIIIEALSSDMAGLRERAVLLIAQLKLVEAIPQLEMMLRDPDEEVASLAKQVLEDFQSET